MIASMVLWRGYLLAGSFFNQDDFYLTGRAYRAELGLEFLTRDTAGHVNPMQQLAYWVVAHHAPYDWGAVAAFVLAMQTATTVVMWLVLSRLLPGRWARVVLLAAFAWAPITLVTTLWWSAAMGLWPHLFCSLLAVLFLLRLRAGDGPAWVNGAVVVGASVLGLLWHERAVLIAPVVLATAVVLTDVPGWRRVIVVLRRHRVLWAVHALLLAGYLGLHAALTDVEGGSVSVRESLGIAGAFLGENALPGLVGGPWVASPEGGAVVPPVWATVLALAVLVLLLLLGLRIGGPGRRWAVAFLGAYLAADLTLLLAGRGGFGRLIGLDPRYSADVIHVGVLCAALTVRGGRPRLGLRPHLWDRWRGVLLVGATTGYLTASLLGSAALVPEFQNKVDREYFTAVRESLARDPRQTLVDDLAPAELVLPLVGEDSLLSRILAPLPETPVFDQPSAHLRTVGDRGRLSATRIAGGVPALAGRDSTCGYRVTPDPVLVRFPAGLSGALLLRLGYFTEDEQTVDLTIGTWGTVFQARPGPNEMWVPVPDLGHEFDRVRLRLRGPGTLCVPEVLAGRAER